MDHAKLRLSAVAIAVTFYAHAASAQQAGAQASNAPPASTEQGDAPNTTKTDMPVSKEVTSSQALRQTQDGYSDVASRQSSVTQASSVGTSAPLYNIRGIRVNPQSNFRLDGGVAITSVQSMPTENKERIETLKGANALMFGIASPSGIVNMIPKRAGERDVTSIGINGNSFGQFGAQIDVGRRLGDQKQLGIRVNASGIRVKNGVRDLEGEGAFASLGLDYRLTSRLTVQGDVEYYGRNTAEQPQIAFANAINGTVPVTRVPDPRANLLGPDGSWADYKPRSLNYQLRADYALDDAWAVLVQAGRSDTERNRHAVRIAGYNVASGANGSVIDQITTNGNVNTFYRIELSGHFGTGSISHNLTTGLSRSERFSESAALNLTLPQRQNIFDPVSIPAPVVTRALTPNLDQNSVDNAIYAYDTIGLLPSLKLLAGLRYTKNTDSIETKADREGSTTSPAVGVLYDLTPKTQIYASYMSGLEAGTVAPGTSANANFVLAPAESKQKEIGIRDTTITGLQLNLSYFDITRANAVVDPITNVYGYSGDLHYKGVEGSASLTLLRSWLLTGGFQWLDVVQNSPSSPLINGKTPENTPEWTANVGIGYRAAWLPGLQLRVGANTVSKRAMNPQNTGYIPGFTLFNLSANYLTRIAGKPTSFQVSVDNAGNKRYWNSVSNGLYGIGMDRSIRFGARMDF
jgi:iron complex outermembrane recepter protein